MSSIHNQRLINRPVLPTLMRLAWPIVVGNAMHLMYNIVDTFWVGRLGPEPLAAVSISFPIIFFVFSVAAGFSIAGIALVSQYTGANDQESANLAAGQVLVFCTFLSLVFAALGLFFGRDMLRLLGASQEIMPYAWDYFKIIVAGIPMIFIFFVFAAILEGIGDTMTPMKLKVASLLFNMILDPFLIFGWSIFPRLGIAGAAYATVLSRSAATLVGVLILLRGRGRLRLKLKDMLPHAPMIKEIVHIGVPGSVAMSAVSITMALVTTIVAHFGTFALAAWGVGNRVLAIIRMPSMGVGRATGVLVGQHIGADQPREAERTAWYGVGVTFAFMVIIAALFFIFAPTIMLIFTSDPLVVNLGVTLLQVGGFAYAFLGIQQVLGGALEGAGQTVAQSAFNLLTLGALQIPLAYLLAIQFDIGLKGIWWAMLIAMMIGSLTISLWFLQGKWQKKVILKPATSS